ncbi:MAG: low specificity L-threonine aldolase [Pirellulales bacterium]
MTSGAERRQFASDNYAGVCPEAWESMQQANAGHSPAYGDDYWTQRASDLLRDLFEIDCEVFFTFNGTAANSLAISSLCQSYHSVLVHELAHIETDECGGPEFFSNGTKVLVVDGANGKVDVDAVTRAVKRRTDIHYPKPRLLSVTQSTESGTVYTTAELDRIGETVRRLGLAWHMDGARFGNAVAALGASPKEITWKLGVDVLCFGGTKAGMAVGECVVFFKKDLAREFAYRCKQAGQLASKMRFLAAPWIGMLESGAWLRHAAHANAMARRLEAALKPLTGVEILWPVEANALFVRFPGQVAQQLRDRGWRFYDFIGAGGSRLMCAWDTQPEDVDAFSADVRQLVAGKP